MNLEDQHDELQKLQVLIKRTWLKNYLRLRITHRKATVDMPEHFNGWLYSKGERDSTDGGPAPYKITPEKLRAFNPIELARFLIERAVASPEFPKSQEFVTITIGNNELELAEDNFANDGYSDISQEEPRVLNINDKGEFVTKDCIIEKRNNNDAKRTTY